jgi:hypothetical protein
MDILSLEGSDFLKGIAWRNCLAETLLNPRLQFLKPLVWNMYIVTEGHAKIEFVICGMKTITKSLEFNEKTCSLNKEAGAGFFFERGNVLY